MHKQPLQALALTRLAPLLAGALAPLGFAPLGLWPLTLVSSMLFLLFMQTDSSREASLRGWFYGIGFFGTGVSWVYVSIHEHGSASPLLAGSLTGLFAIALGLLFALHGFLYQRLVPRHAWGQLLGFPALWVMAEWFRSWFLTGFPWLLIGYAPLDSWLAGWAPIGGVFSLSLLLSLCASLVALVLLRQITPLLLLVIPALWLTGYALQQIDWVRPATHSELSVALVQGNIPQVDKWDPSKRGQILSHYYQLTQPHLNNALIVWPETAIPDLYDRAIPLLAPFIDQLRSRETALISGVPFRSGSKPVHYYNSLTALGDAQGIYHKQRLVPFGEYVPLEAQLRGLITFFDLPMSNFSLGPSEQKPLILSASGIRVAPFICYEIVYPDLVASNTRGQDLLLTVSNDSWFGDSWAPQQHLQMARMRALENGRYLLRSTNNGISAIVDERGQIKAQGDQFVSQVVSGTALIFQGSTPFALWGSAPTVALALLVLIALMASHRCATRKPRLAS